MNLKFFTLIILFATSQLVYAENHLLLIGGGGEPKRDYTIFDSFLNNLGVSLKKLNWKYEVSVNGGHKNTEEIIKNHYSKSKTPATNFTAQNYKELIQSYKLKIQNNEIKSGDQLMIIIYTHGARREEGELSHKIATSGHAPTNLTSLSGSTLVNLDDLQEIIQLTNNKGIRLGIVDLSCHSGATLALKDKAPNTCIVSSTGPEHYAYAGPKGFGENFIKVLKPGLSLEEAFLQGRLATTDGSYPMISTNENDNIVKDIYEKITPYLYYSLSETDKLNNYIFDNAAIPLLCSRDENFKDLISKVDALKSAVNSKYNSLNADKLKELLKNYKEIQDNILKITIELESPKLDTIEDIPIPKELQSTIKDAKIQYTWRELFFLEVDDLIYVQEYNKKTAKTKQEENLASSMIEYLTKIKERKTQILYGNLDIYYYKSRTNSLISSIRNSESIAFEIAKQEKIFYENYYRRNQMANTNDPCKSIKF